MTSMPLIYSIIAPLIIISSVAVYQGEAFTAIETARLLQNCMLIAGVVPCKCSRKIPKNLLN